MLKTGRYVKRTAFHPCLFVTIAVGLALTTLGFVLSRVHLFQHEYNRITVQRENDAWLLARCEEDDFYHNMKHHSALCDEMTVARRESIILLSLQAVVKNTYVCGYQPCLEIVDSLVAWVLGRGFAVTMALCFCVLMLPSIFLPMLRLQYTRAHEAQIRSRFNDPYGRLMPLMDTYHEKEL